MPQINLTSGGGDPTQIGKSSHGSLFFSIAILIVSFGIYFGAFFYESSLKEEIALLDAKTTENKNLISDKKTNRVADFADRLSIIGKGLEDTSLWPNDSLLKIERSLIPEVDIDSYEYSLEGRTVNIEFSADSFRSLAQYIITLKNENFFSSVTLDGESRVNTDGRVESKIILTF